MVVVVSGAWNYDLETSELVGGARISFIFNDVSRPLPDAVMSMNDHHRRGENSPPPSMRDRTLFCTVQYIHIDQSSTSETSYKLILEFRFYAL